MSPQSYIQPVLSLHCISPTSLLFSRLDILFYFIFGILILFFFTPSALLPFVPFSQIMASTSEYTVIGCVLISSEFSETLNAFNLNTMLLLMHSRIVLIYLPAESHCGLLWNLKSSRTKQQQN